MPIFCVSDLHLCDRGYRDNFAVEGREARFYKFLDYVEAEGGQLYVLGDLFDFWQANLSKVVVAYLDLLTRLDKMRAVYVMGNHDCAFVGVHRPAGLDAGAPAFPARGPGLRADHRRPAVRLPPRPRVGPLLPRPEPRHRRDYRDHLRDAGRPQPGAVTATVMPWRTSSSARWKRP